MRGKVNCTMSRSELGSITARGKGTWLVRVTAGRDPSTGKQVRKAKTVHGTKKKAREVLNDMLAQIGKMPGRDMTLGAYIDGMYAPWHDKRYTRRDSSRKFHECMGKLVEELGYLKLGELTRYRMETWAADAPAWKVVKLHAALEKAVQWELIERNPLKGLDRASDKKDERRLSVEQVADVLDAVRDSIIEPGVILQVYCGLRNEEVLALDWADIDFAKARVPIVKSYHYHKGEGWFEDPKNKTSCGVVSIPSAALDRLRQIRCKGDVIRTGPLMVSTVTLKRLSPNSYGYYWRKIAQPLLGEDYIPVKNLRHTHGSILFDAGMSAEFIKERLRHASTRISERYYIKPGSIADETCAEAFDEALRERSSCG